MSPTAEFELSLVQPFPSLKKLALQHRGPANLRIKLPAGVKVLSGKNAAQSESDNGDFVMPINVPSGDSAKSANYNDYMLALVDAQDKPCGATTIRVTPIGRGDELSDDA